MKNITEHSRQLRAKTATAWTKQKIAEGKIRQILLKLDSAIADEFDAICREMGVSRPQGLKALCQLYRDKA